MRIKKTSFIHILITAALLLLAFLPNNAVFLGGLRKYLCYAGQLGCLIWGIVLFRDIYLKMDRFLILLCVFQMEIIASAFLHHTSINAFARIAFQILSISVLVRSMARTRPKELMIALMLVFELFALINLIYRIPDRPIEIIEETGPIYFLGSDNEVTSPMLLLLITSILYTYYYRPNLLSVLGVALPTFTAVYSMCGTAVMVFTVFAAGIVLYRIAGSHRIIKQFSSAGGVVLIYAVYYFVIFSITMAKFSFLGDLITRLTGKNAVTFTNRDVIWMEVFRIIRNNLLLGIGYGGGAVGNGVYVKGFYFGAHNLLLQWGVNGGLVAMAMFLLLLWMVLKRIERLDSEKRFYIYLGLLVYLIAMSMENYSNGLHILPILTMLYYINYTTERMPAVFQNKTRDSIWIRRLSKMSSTVWHISSSSSSPR